jgi:hypothetical protein
MSSFGTPQRIRSKTSSKPFKAAEPRLASPGACEDSQALRTALWETSLEAWRQGGWVASIPPSCSEG